MKKFLKRLRLIDHLETELKIRKDDFADLFRAHVDEGSTNHFSGVFEVFSSSSNQYKGTVGYEGFKIRRRRRLFDTNMNLAVATGSFFQKGETLVITTEINGFASIFIPYYIFLTVIYFVGIVVSIFVGMSQPQLPLFIFPFILLHAAFMYLIPYFIMRRSVKNMKRELEREFFFVTKK